MRTLLVLSFGAVAALTLLTGGALALLPAVALARTVTLVAPTEVMGLSVHRTSDGYEVMVHACAQSDASTDGAEPLTDCGATTLRRPLSDAALSDLFTRALAAWKRQKGY